MILVVGASVRALMESAVKSGYQVMGIDFFGDMDACRQGKTLSLVKDCSLEPTVKNLIKVARTISCHGLVYGSGPENFPEELMPWEKKGLLMGNGPSVLREVRNPWKLSRCLKEIGGKMPEFFALGEKRVLPGGEKWLLKPLHRGGGHGIMELSGGNVDKKGLISPLKNPEQYIIEKYIEGISGSMTFLANGREAVLLGTSRQLIGRRANTFRYEGNIIPLNMGDIFQEQIFLGEGIKIIDHLTRGFGLKGLNTLDFIINKEGIWVLEVNPRWSGSVELIESHLGISLFSAHLSAGKGIEISKIIREITPQCHRRGYWGKTIIFANNDLSIEYDHEKTIQFLYTEGVRDIPPGGTIVKRGEPLCTVLTWGATDNECQLKLAEKSFWVQQFYSKEQKMGAADVERLFSKGGDEWALCQDY